MTRVVVAVVFTTIVLAINFKSGKSRFLLPKTSVEEDSARFKEFETFDPENDPIVVTDQSADPSTDSDGLRTSSSSSSLDCGSSCWEGRSIDRRRRKRSVDDDLPDPQTFGFHQKTFFQPGMIPKLYYRPLPSLELEPKLRREPNNNNNNNGDNDSTYQNLFDFNNGYRFPIRVGHLDDFVDDSNPDKRALSRNKMIRLFRRDGLKVLRLRRNEPGQSFRENDPELWKPENEAESVPEKRWTHQEKQRSDSLKVLRLRRNQGLIQGPDEQPKAWLQMADPEPRQHLS